jgi:shikimate dehydrogenase
MKIRASTRLFALLGDPVDHSLSPLMQNAALQAASLDAVYVALRCGSDDVCGLATGIARAGGGGNVTVPHKRRVIAAVERPTEAVNRTGACNTFWLEQGRVCGDNTDVAGFHAAAVALTGSLAGMRALVIGAGGAARAAVAALLSANAREVNILNRSRERAVTLTHDLQTAPPRLRHLTGAEQIVGEFDLVVNATPLGLHDDPTLPLDLSRMPRVGAALDMVARTGGTAWSQHAASLGIPVTDGKEMLIAQGAAAFERWFDRPAPIEAMRAALQTAMPDTPVHHVQAPESSRA